MTTSRILACYQTRKTPEHAPTQQFAMDTFDFYIYHYTCRSSRCSWSDFSGDDFGITLLNRPWRHTFTSRPRSLGGSLFSATSSRKTIAQEIDSIQCASVSESVVGDSHACLGSLN